MGAAIAPAAALMGEPTRAAMLVALVEGRALAAGELARRAGVSAATASAHLARLLDGRLVSVIKQGRHRYYQLAGRDVAAAIEALSRLAPPTPPVNSLRQARDRDALRRARSCYDHLAGQAGVELYAALLGTGTLIAGANPGSGGGPGKPGDRSGDYAFVDLADGAPFEGLGIDVDRLRHQRRAFVRSCLDWTERAPHLAGALGAVLLERMLALGWLRRPPNGGRGLIVTAEGTRGLADWFGCRLS
ncbi:MAG TPA: helix-turn-helix transcriptional regulator [Actinomycetes bacterium]|nr:helix-turn-helix transcriptional regulator [Actinomycetes bacterium]